MKRFPTRYDLYISRSVILSVLMTWGVLLGLFVMMSFADQFKDVGTGRYSVNDALTYVAFCIPRNAYNVFPTAAVIGALLGLGQLATSSELTALRALGVARWRLCLSVVSLIALITLVMTRVGQTVAPLAQNKADTLKVNAQHPGTTQFIRYAGLWAREGNIYLNAHSGEEIPQSDGSKVLALRDVTMYAIAPTGQIESVTRSRVLEHNRQGWLMSGVTRDTFVLRAVKREEFATLVWPSRLDPKALEAGLIRPRGLSDDELRQGIAYRRRNGIDARDFEDQYWNRWFYPLNVVSLCLSALPFAFGSLRSGGMGKRLFLGILFALGFWLLQLFFGRIAGALHLNYAVAYALPPVVMLLGTFAVFYRLIR